MEAVPASINREAQDPQLFLDHAEWNNLGLDFWEFPIADGLVVARPDVHGLFLLNSTARQIWTEACHNVPREDIATGLVSVYGIPFDRALHDVRALLESLTLPATPSPEPSVRPSAPTTAHHFSLNGRVFRLACGSVAIENEILPRLQHLRVAPSHPDYNLDVLESEEAYTLWQGRECLASEDSVGAIRARLLQELVRLNEPGRQWLALFHAGACALSDRCIIFPAASHSGKTTLAATLMQDGFTLLSDDFVGLERATQRIPPMPFALTVREGSWPLLRGIAALPSYDRFGERVKFLPPQGNRPPLAANALVFTARRPDKAPTLEPLSTLESLVALKESGFWVVHTQSGIAEFINWLQALPSYRLVYSKVEDAVAQLRFIMNSR